MAFEFPLASTYRRGLRCLLSALIVLLASGTAGAQGFFPRGDVDCSGDRAAADMLLSVRAIGGDDLCGNNDCDRDGAATGADLDCGARCLFGSCPSIADGPTATGVVPASAPDIRAMTLLRVGVVNLGDPEAITQATIGGIGAPIVDLGEPGFLGIVVPAGVAPGPADLVIISGDVPGPPLSITIAEATPLGDPDTYDDTLAMLEELMTRVLALDLEGGFGDNAPLVRGAFEDIRDALAMLRSSIASDPTLTPAGRAELDAAIDASGLPDLLRAAIAEVEEIEAGGASSSTRGGRGPFPPTIAIRAAAVAGRTLVTAGGIILGAPPAAVAGVIVATIATATGIILIFAAGATAPPTVPLILSLTFMPGDMNLPRADGTVTVRAANITPGRASLVIRKPAQQSIVVEPSSTVDDEYTFMLPGDQDQSFCGRVDLVLQDTMTLRSSARVPIYVQPRIARIDPDEPYAGTEIDIPQVGGRACIEQTYAVFERASDNTKTYREVSRRDPLTVTTPDIPLDFYNLHLSVLGIMSNPGNLQIRGITQVSLQCDATNLFVAPKTPNRTECRLHLVPSSAPMPRNGRVTWQSSDTEVGQFGASVGSSQTLFALNPGMATGTAALECGSNTFICSIATRLNDSVTFTVKDETEPTITVQTVPAAGEVRPGRAIQVTARVVDNIGLKSVVLTPSGEAVEGGPQNFTCSPTDPECEASFTVNLKRDGFSNPAVSLVVMALDSSDNVATAPPVTFTVTGMADTAPPVVTVLAPAEGARFDAGATVQVSIHATDNGASDAGVKQTLIRVEGPAVASGPDPERACMTVPAGEVMRDASFRIKDAAALANVSDRNILIVIQATDASGAGCEDGNSSAVQFIHVKAGAVPMIISVPAEVNAGEQITITGQNFGAAQGASVVTIGGSTVPVVSWSDTSIVVTVPTTVSGQNLAVIVSVAALDSNAAAINVLGTGDVQITLVWQDTNDLDLHVFDPMGVEIYYGNRSSPSGGTLDVDANAGCGGATSSPRENVFWPPGTAPTGQYTVRVVYFTGCTEPEVASAFTVTVKLGNMPPTTLFSGSVGPGNLSSERNFTR